MKDQEKVKDLTKAIEGLRKDYKGQLSLLDDVKKQVDKATLKRDDIYENMKIKEAQIAEGFEKLKAVQKNQFDKNKELDLRARGLDDARTKLNEETNALVKKGKEIDEKDLRHNMKVEKDSQSLTEMENDKQLVIKSYQKKMGELGRKEDEVVNKREKEMVAKVHMIDEELANVRRKVEEHQSKINLLRNKEDELLIKEKVINAKGIENNAVSVSLESREKEVKRKEKELEELSLQLQALRKEVVRKIEVNNLKKELEIEVPESK